MKFNPDKYEVLQVTNKNNRIPYDYKIHDTALAFVKSPKYLGLNISFNLSWNYLIDTTTKKANSFTALLKGKIKTCSKTIKAKCSTALVRQIMGYASSLWDLPTHENKHKLEMV